MYSWFSQDIQISIFILNLFQFVSVVSLTLTLVQLERDKIQITIMDLPKHQVAVYKDKIIGRFPDRRTVYGTLLSRTKIRTLKWDRCATGVLNRIIGRFPEELSCTGHFSSVTHTLPAWDLSFWDFSTKRTTNEAISSVNPIGSISPSVSQCTLLAQATNYDNDNQLQSSRSIDYISDSPGADNTSTFRKQNELNFEYRGIHVVNLNVRHLKPKIDDAKIMLQEINNVDILGLFETFLNRNVDDGTINTDGYKTEGKIEIHSAQFKITLGAELLYIDCKPYQVAYETELSGTPTAVFTGIRLIGQFLVLGIIILI